MRNGLLSAWHLSTPHNIHTTDEETEPRATATSQHMAESGVESTFVGF